MRTIKLCPKCGKKTSSKVTTCRGCGASLNTNPIFNAYRMFRSTSSNKPISDAEIMEELGLNDEKNIEKLKERYGYNFLERVGIKKEKEEEERKEEERQFHDSMTEFMAEYTQEQKINIEKTKIILGEEYVRKALEEDPKAQHSFHLSEPYKSMSLEELRRLFKR